MGKMGNERMSGWTIFKEMTHFNIKKIKKSDLEGIVIDGLRRKTARTQKGICCPSCLGKEIEKILDEPLPNYEQISKLLLSIINDYAYTDLLVGIITNIDRLIIERPEEFESLIRFEILRLIEYMKSVGIVGGERPKQHGSFLKENE